MINSVGEIATAAHTIANTVESAFYVPAYGMQTAAATLAGNAYGAGDKKRMKNITTLLIVIELRCYWKITSKLFPLVLRCFEW